jgi:hypothetical protein
MCRVEGKLAAWHQLHKHLEDARLRLTETEDGPAREVLEAEVRRLTREDDAAIEAVHAALATVKKIPGAATST